MRGATISSKGQTKAGAGRGASSRAAGTGAGKPIAAVERALQVLSAFRTEPRLTLSELSRRTGLYKSTLLRILMTLERHGYITRLDDGEYRVGGVVFELGSGYQASFRLEEVIRPALEALARATGESAAFYARTGPDARQCLFRVESPQSVRAVIQPGEITRFGRAAAGQLFVHYGKERERPADTAGYGELCRATSGIGDPATASVAAPIFDTGGFIGVINVSGPVHRFTEAAVSRITTRLATTAGRISLALGGIRPG